MTIPHPQHLPHATGELLYRSPHHPAHAGIPLVAPWFAQTLGPQMHGWARTMNWQQHGDSATLTHDGFTLHFHEQLGRYSLRLRNDATTARPAQLALHPYWAISNTDAVRVEGLSGATYFDKTTNTQRMLNAPIRLGAETDAVIAATGPVTLHDTHRALTLRAQGIDHWVVWNPGPTGCAAADDLDDDEWRHFICIEPALLGPERAGVLVGPGETISITLEVSAHAR